MYNKYWSYNLIYIIIVSDHLLLAEFINNLFGEISYVQNFLCYYHSQTSIKPKNIMLFEKTVVFESLIDTYNYIFLTSIQPGAELNSKDDILQAVTTINIILIRGIFL